VELIACLALQFDHFSLDLARGCLRAGDQDIYLRPKTFDVLRYLVENAGRLISRQELHDAVWPKVAVSDDSLVQCIRELRKKLGDDGHRLIKTVPRRGYRFDSTVTAFTSQTPPSSRSLEDDRTVTPSPWQRLAERRERRPWMMTAVGVLVGALTAAWLAATLLVRPGDGAPTRLFTEADARRITEIADVKELPVPDFRVYEPSDDVSKTARSFIGVWVSDAGWINSRRQLMLMITSARDDVVSGYAVHGPAQPKSRAQTPAHASSFRAQVIGRTFKFNEGADRYIVSFARDSRINIELKFREDTVGWIVLDPVWTLADAESQQGL
jgi:DNA-binding winged helix-turn-helix (wHTH) protein